MSRVIPSCRAVLGPYAGVEAKSLGAGSLVTLANFFIVHAKVNWVASDLSLTYSLPPTLAYGVSFLSRRDMIHVSAN